MKTIYILKDPITGSTRYVGATSQPLKKRVKLHVYGARAGYTNRCADWIRGLLELGLWPSIHALQSSDDWQAAERSAIAEFRAAGVPLLNQTDGGYGCLNCFPSGDTKRKRSSTLKSRYSGDAAQMAARQELARQAARSPGGRAAASARMKSIWSDPVRAAEMRERMKGSKSRKAAAC